MTALCAGTASDVHLPTAGADNSSLPGMGGVFNATNCHLYHYAGNNPVRYVDPDGRSDKVFNRGGHFVEIIESETNNIYLRDGYLEFNHLVTFDVLLTTQKEFESLVNKVYGETASLRPESNNLKALLDARAAIAHVAQNAPESSMRSAEANLDNPIEFRELLCCVFCQGQKRKKRKKIGNLPTLLYLDHRPLGLPLRSIDSPKSFPSENQA